MPMIAAARPMPPTTRGLSPELVEGAGSAPMRGRFPYWPRSFENDMHRVYNVHRPRRATSLFLLRGDQCRRSVKIPWNREHVTLSGRSVVVLLVPPRQMMRETLLRHLMCTHESSFRASTIAWINASMRQLRTLVSSLKHV